MTRHLLIEPKVDKRFLPLRCPLAFATVAFCIRRSVRKAWWCGCSVLPVHGVMTLGTDGGAPISTSQSDDLKRRLRRTMRARRAALSQAERHRYSAQITAYACDLPMYRASVTVMVYMALEREVQTTALIAHARRHHKRVVVPVVTPEGLLAVLCPTEASGFRPGPFGILEPCDLSAAVSPDEIDMVFVPGVGFDAKGVRLGYGGGYYDRFLHTLPAHTHFGGLAFHCQLVPSIPRLPHDICMPFVVTEQGVFTYDTVTAPCGHTPATGRDKGEDR